MKDAGVPVAIPVIEGVAAQPTVREGPATDANGIYVGQWKAGVFDCFNHLVPNCCMAYWCPCISLGQTMARVSSSGMIYMVAYGVLYLLSIGLSCSAANYSTYYNRYWDSDIWDDDTVYVGTWQSYSAPFPSVVACILILVARSTIRNLFKIPGNCCEDCLCSFCCSCCVLAQMSTHVEAYTPGECQFNFKEKLPGYSV